MQPNYDVIILGLSRWDDILNSFLPVFCRTIPENIQQPLVNIYQSVDDISQEKYIAKHGIKQEKTAIQECDIAIASSTELCNRLSNYGKPVHLIQNAADVSLFSKVLDENILPPDEIKNAGGKIIIFTGHVNHLRIDYELIKQIATTRIHDTLLIVGPFDKRDHLKHNFGNYKSIVFTGSKPVDQLPHYLKFASCAIIPFLKNRLTRSIYPLKINEYLAVGLPVVTSDFSEDIMTFSDVAYIARDHQEFLDQIEKGIKENDELKKQDRILYSMQNTWGCRIDRLKLLIDNYVSGSPPL